MNPKLQNLDVVATAPDAFLSGVFGYTCWSALPPYELPAIEAELAAMHAPSFVWLKLDSKDDPAFRALSELGFDIAVEEITYTRPPSTLSETAPPVDFEVSVLSAADARGNTELQQDIGNLSALNLTTSRFHQDPLITPDIAANVKRQWAMNFFDGLRGQEMVIARTKDGTVIGFNQVLENGSTKTIDLICTDSAWRRKGVARALVNAMLTPDKTIRVGSQANNATADTFYRDLGFEPISSSICMHWHAQQS